MKPRLASFISCAAMLAATCAHADDFPVKPLRIITYPAGGGTDFTARVIAQGLTAALGQSIIVDNRPGGVIQGELLAKAPPDGYTLLLNGSALWLAPFMQDARYNPLELTPVTAATVSPNVLVIHPSVPVKSVHELIALAKAKPGALNYASGPPGVPNHLAAELFKSLAHVNVVRVAYKGGGPALNDLLAGQVHLLFASVGTVIPHVKSGRLRALGVTSASPSRIVPDVPPIAASGLPDYEILSTDAIFAPPRTAPAMVNRLNEEIARVLAKHDVKEKLFKAGVETVGSTPAELASTVKAEMTRLGAVIKAAGIRAE